MKVITTVTSIDPLKGGGVCEAIFNLNQSIMELFKNDIRSEVCSLDYNTPNYIKKKWSIFQTKLFKAYDPFLYAFSPPFKAYILHSNADILHNHGVWEYTSHVCLSWKRKLKKPYIITPHGMLDYWALDNNKFKKKLFYNLFEKKYLSNAACIHALNEEEAISIIKLELKTPICIIPNGITLPKNEKLLSPIWDKEKTKNKKILLFLGRLHPKKGLENLLLAWSNLFKQGKCTEWVLIIVGWSQNAYDKKLKQIAAKNNLNDSVLFLGPVLGNDKSSVLQNADAFILPSYSEGLPISILEAWAYKLPVLMTKECNLSEGVSKNCAIEIETTIENIMLNLQIFFSLSEIERSTLGKNGFELVKEKYTWEKVASQMLNLYKWVYGEGPKPSVIYEK